MLKKAEILKDVLGKIENEMKNEKGMAKGLFSVLNIAEIKDCVELSQMNNRYITAMEIKKCELALRSLIYYFETKKDATDFFDFNVEDLSYMEKYIDQIINNMRSMKYVCEIPYELLMDFHREISKCKNKRKYMITSMSIINRLKKEEFRAIYTEDEKPCEDAFLDTIKDCCGEECTRYFVILNNDTKAFEDFRAKTGTTVMVTENTTFNCPELVLFDEKLDEDYYLS